MKSRFLNRGVSSLLIAGITLISCEPNSIAQSIPTIYTNNPNPIANQPDPLPTEKRHPTKKIKLALLLDTSNSMDGLIDQTKSQLWMMVNELAEAKCDNLRPTLEIALYEYGNDRLQSRNGYIRMVTPLTQDLDQISEDLFALTTNGGNEYCGQVIYTSLNDLDWSESGKDLQLIFIAGNEPFTQGPTSYKTACRYAQQNKVTINTIYCGEFDEGINTNWKDGAILTGGDYMSIDQNSRTVYIASPYDKDIAALNSKLNDTYISYGKIGYESKQKQEAQDKNAQNYGLQNMVSRAVTKSKHIYKNSRWDLVDALEEDDSILEELEDSDMNEEMKGMSAEQRKQYIVSKAKERKRIQEEITDLGNKRKTFVAAKQKASSNQQRLDNAMLSAISKQAKEKNFTF